MASVSEIVDILAREMDEDPSFVRQVSRRLLDAGILPKSRGRNIAEVDEKDIASLLIGVLVTDKYADAAERTTVWSELTFGGEKGDRTLLELFTDALQAFNQYPFQKIEVKGAFRAWYSILQIEIVTSYPVAFVRSVFTTPSEEKDSWAGSLVFAQGPAQAMKWPSIKPRKSVTIPGHFFMELMNRVKALETMKSGLEASKG